MLINHNKNNNNDSNLENYQQGKYQIKTFNKISPIGLSRFPDDEYDVRTGDAEAANAHAIMLRSHKLQEEEVPKTVRAIARYVKTAVLLFFVL